MVEEDCTDLNLDYLPLSFKTIISSVKFDKPFVFLFSFAGSLYILDTDQKHNLIKIQKNLPVIQTFVLFLLQNQNDNYKYSIYAILKSGKIMHLELQFNSEGGFFVDQQISYESVVDNTEDIIDFCFIEKLRCFVLTTKRYILSFKTNQGATLINKKILQKFDEDIIHTQTKDQKFLISTLNQYFSLDLISLQTIKIGSQEKRGLFTATFSTSGPFIYAGRQNGILWKADIVTGQVKKSLKFQNIEFGTIICLKNEFLVNLCKNKIDVIDLNKKIISKSFSLDHPIKICDLKNLIFYYVNDVYHIICGQFKSVQKQFQKYLQDYKNQDFLNFIYLIYNNKSLHTKHHVYAFLEIYELEFKSKFILPSFFTDLINQIENQDYFIEDNFKQKHIMIQDQQQEISSNFITQNIQYFDAEPIQNLNRNDPNFEKIMKFAKEQISKPHRFQKYDMILQNIRNDITKLQEQKKVQDCRKQLINKAKTVFKYSKKDIFFHLHKKQLLKTYLKQENKKLFIYSNALKQVRLYIQNQIFNEKQSIRFFFRSFLIFLWTYNSQQIEKTQQKRNFFRKQYKKQLSLTRQFLLNFL